MGKCDETGNCAKCVHTAEIQKARDSGDEHAIACLRKTCLKCIRGCEKCRFGRRIDALEGFIRAKETGKGEDDLRSEILSLKRDTCRKCNEKGCSVCKTAATIKGLELAANVFREVNKATKRPIDVEAAKDLCDAITQKFCLKCSRCPSTDDNPSRGGKEVISFDSAEDPDTIMPFADPLAFQTSDDDLRDFDRQSSRMTLEREGRRGVTASLPQSVEDALRQEICNLCGKLDHIDRALVFFLMTGGSLTDFGKMQWVPPEFFKTLSKQFVYGRYKKIVRAVPILSAVAHGMIGKGKGGGCKPKKDKDSRQLTLF